MRFTIISANGATLGGKKSPFLPLFTVRKVKFIHKAHLGPLTLDRILPPLTVKISVSEETHFLCLVSSQCKDMAEEKKHSVLLWFKCLEATGQLYSEFLTSTAWGKEHFLWYHGPPALCPSFSFISSSNFHSWLILDQIHNERIATSCPTKKMSFPQVWKEHGH